jgi:hypothetical protein
VVEAVIVIYTLNQRLPVQFYGTAAVMGSPSNRAKNARYDSPRVWRRQCQFKP